MANAIHWGRKVYVATKHAAWHDVHEYEVPYSGTADANKMRIALTAGKHDKRPKPWLGACGDVDVVSVDEQRKVIRVEISHPIGD